MTARAIMVLGTASHVGKSLMTAALCRIFARVGYSVAPFKAQNMSLNSAATPDGYEIGRAQALQAEAAGIAPSVHMNPILIKPSGDCSSQMVVRGKVWGNLDASTYHKHRVITLLPIVEESYRELASRHDIVVLEGAGSPAEINLKDSDIVNMRMAKLAQAACLLVGDIDRGGVFASLLGTCELLDEEERVYVRGFIINKFRGDLALLEPGVRMMEERLEKRCMGVVPYLKNLTLDAEDSVGFGQRERPTWPQQQTATRRLQIGVVAFPSISNFTDFDALDAEPSVALKYFHDPIGIEAADVIILPGSKQTVDDLRWMQERAFDRAVLRHAEKGGLIAGICGGFQMLGEEIVDSHGVERAGIEQGLGLLSVRTIMAQDKVTVTQCGALNKQLLFGQPIDAIDVNGYEIHLGTTEYLDGAVPFASLLMCGDETPAHSDGCISPDQRIFGTYLHGIFDADTFRHSFLRASRAALQMPAPRQLIAWSEKRRQQLDLLADAFGKALDLNAIFGMVGLSFPPNREDRTL